MRLIDADLLKKQMESVCMGIMAGTDSYDAPLKTIDDAPTIDPVKHGEWIPRITAMGTMIFRCSACQKFNDVHWAYCPQCGAMMDGERKG